MTASELYQQLLDAIVRVSRERCVDWYAARYPFDMERRCHHGDRMDKPNQVPCPCEETSRENLELLLLTAELHGWKLMPMIANEDMAEAANFATSRWHDIKGSQLTVNREKAKIRWQAMANKVPQVKR